MPLQHQEHETGHGQTPTSIWRDHIRRDLWRKGRQAQHGAIPAFVMSGDTALEHLCKAQESGDQLLHKPVQPMKLRAMVSHFLKSVHA